MLTTLPGGRRVLLAGQKSGMLHALDPDTGQFIWQTRVGEGGVLGGIEWGFATDGSTAYVSLSNALERKAGEAGGLVAVNVAGGMLFVTSGYGSLGFSSGNVLLALSVDGK